MKIPFAAVLSIACLVGATAQTSESGSTSTTQKSTTPRITLPADKPGTSPGATAGKAKDAKAADAKGAAKGAAKKKEETPKIDGLEIGRGAKGFLGIKIVDSTFKLTFYDEQKKPAAIDVDRAALRWDPKYKVGEERVVLTPSSDGKALTSAKNIRPPYNFKLFITLIKDATESQQPVNETYTIDFRQ